MKKILAKRKEHRLFGRGSIEFMTGDNPRVLAFVREYEGEAVLVVANLSKYVQCARINLERFKSMIPTELFGRMRFPEITDQPYFISLGAYDFYWLSLAQATTAEANAERPLLHAQASWLSLLEPSRRTVLAKTLMSYVADRRWFRSKARTRKHVAINDIVRFENDRYAIALLGIEYDQGPAETYVVPIAFAEDAEPSESMRTPQLVIAQVAVANVPNRGDRPVTGVIYDALCADGFNTALMRAMTDGTGATGERGQLAGSAFTALREAGDVASLIPRATAADQSNSGVVYGDKLILKIFRAVEEGPNAEFELARFFSTREYRGSPRLAGVLEYRAPGHEPSTLGTMFEFVPNQGDAWALTMSALDRYFEHLLADNALPTQPPAHGANVVDQARLPPSDEVIDWVGSYIDNVRLLGLRTAELHLVLDDEPNDPLFAPEPYDIMHQQSIYGSVSALMARTFDLLRAKLRLLNPDLRALAETVVAREAEIDSHLAQITKRRIDVQRTRIHGDYHLGQVLWTGENFLIIDFEGEPGRPLSQRRFKRSALRDVAGMLRSLQYASAAALRDGRHRAEDVPRLEVWARAWSDWVSASFLGGYMDRARGTKVVPPNESDLKLLLDFFLLEKCIYEIGYELNNRPEWLEIPLRNMLALLPAKS
jgi:maltose alpha-D-glucosyltransferase/alpha-amylase